MYHISDSEWEIMRVIWAKERVGSSEIIETLSRKWSWSPSTVKTLLGRLVDKGLVSSQRQGRAYLYQAEISEKEAHRSEVDGVFAKICMTEHTSLIDHLISQTPMTLSDIERLEALLLSKKEQAVERVVCNCEPGQCRCARHMEVTDE
ncbi:CopY/TcrY family copper transport repressor [Streptococcus hillyeri]|uniref:CopY/TcrY family copper transport repressor n=1 Tax=Streptococcus hillyeri TaxID=2282420 RepID=A0A3L9DR48_9STRE|nr:CopY/TcrY family copper transport repressor [Streptococcus hillyeri]RLY03801.1 CopY/TcrY family copper transport repressor [Streptococcus hillyeri]